MEAFAALEKQNAGLKFRNWTGNLMPKVDTTIESDALIAGVDTQDNIQGINQNQTENNDKDHNKNHDDEDYSQRQQDDNRFDKHEDNNGYCSFSLF